jgi:polyisoprenoid-binding protein YceI
MMMRRTLALALALAATATVGRAEETWTVDRGHSEVSFQIRHFVTKVRGAFNDFEGTIVADAAKPESSKVEFTIKAASIDTANERRDNDLRGANFFEVEKFPEITFKSSRVVKKDKDHFDVTGTLAMHGVSKEVTLPVVFLGAMKDARGNDKAGFSSDLTLNRKDFGITWNRALDQGGAMLGDDVAISINLETNKKVPPTPAPAASPAKD